MNWCGILLFLIINLQEVAGFVSLRPAGGVTISSVYNTYKPSLQSYTKPSVDEELQSSELIVEDEQQNDTMLPSASTEGMVDNISDLAIPTPDETRNLPALWARRLITKEDPFSIHKLSSISYTLSAIIILGTATVRYLDSPEVFAVVPEYLRLPTYVFTISNFIMCIQSVRMAFFHRRYDLTARNAFLGTAVSSSFSGFYYLWTSPFGLDAFNNQLINQACFAVFTLLNTVFIMDTIVKVPEVVESRRDRKTDDYKGRFAVDAIGYVLPVAWGLPLVLGTAYLDAVLYDREWFFNQCQYIDQVRGFPGIQANLSYLQVAASVAASYGSLFVTLRDKKLISKNQEIGWISIFSIPTMIWAVLVSAEFLSYLEWS